MIMAEDLASNQTFIEFQTKSINVKVVFSERLVYKIPMSLVENADEYNERVSFRGSKIYQQLYY